MIQKGGKGEEGGKGGRGMCVIYLTERLSTPEIDFIINNGEQGCIFLFKVKHVFSHVFSVLFVYYPCRFYVFMKALSYPELNTEDFYSLTLVLMRSFLLSFLIRGGGGA